MTYKDAELVLESIATIAKTNLRRIIDNINSEKGDDLLLLFEDNEQYFLGYLEDFPTFESFYLQYVVSDPKVIPNKSEMALRVSAQIAVFYPFQDADINYKRKLRYNRVLYELINTHVKKKYPSIMVEGFGSTFLADEDEDREMIVSELAFSFDVIY